MLYNLLERRKVSSTCTVVVDYSLLRDFQNNTLHAQGEVEEALYLPCLVGRLCEQDASVMLNREWVNLCSLNHV